MNILYVVSTLKRSGPTNQLYSLVNHLDKEEHNITILTLSSESDDSRWEDFHKMGVELKTLELTRVDSLFKGRAKVKEFIKINGPFDVVHSQGIRADSILSKVEGNFRWFITSHNNPDIDYPMKFGAMKGLLMAWKHKRILGTCERVISCSKTIKSELNEKGIKSHAIQNGVELNEIDKHVFKNLNGFERPIFISVGSLIDRKNMGPIIKAFNTYSIQNPGTLFIIGDGPLKDELKRTAGDRVIFTGNIDHVPSYLKSADYFISASKAEGLPYTVLEALGADLPVILSDIPSHEEIHIECSNNCIIFNRNNSEESLFKIFEELQNSTEKYSGSRKVAEEVFSAVQMTRKYEEFYKN